MRPAAALALVAFCAWTAGAQSKFSLESPLFLPSSFFVGDMVEMRVLVRTPEKVAEPGQAVHISWGVVHELRLARHGDRHEIRVFFTPYMPGTQIFPALRLGGIVLPELKVQVRSLIEDGYSEPAPPRPQMVLPGTRLLLGMLAAAGLAVPAAVFLILRFGRGFALGLLGAWRRRFPGRQLKRALKELGAKDEALDSRGFYFQLLGALKRYLTARLGLDLGSATTPELLRKLPARVDNPGVMAELEELFSYGDAVKFGGRPAAAERRRRDLDLVGRLEGRLADREESHADL